MKSQRNKLIKIFIIILIVILNCNFNYSKGNLNQEEKSHESLFKKIIDIIGKWINFAALILILYFFLVKVMDVPGIFRKISDNIIKGINSSKESKESAIRQMEEIKNKLSNLDEELKQIKEDTAKILKQEEERIMLEAEIEAKRIREMAHREIEWRTKEAVKDLKEHALTVATSLSEKIIKSELSEKDHHKLIEYFIKSLKDKK